ncbi:Vacuolar protein sorting-associated protein vps5 [Mycoemilia scoparia]|uniref:Vacuolar protein sorting-associated protein vps5 n=1 Tax=Mycoemilia scoparia TaxID=417184 RepID=A0A9W7ZQQ5_9FUNG|nr:Vacuolar protein sorting-associated protein vps5 [Mycoemilia scoparia]
MNSEHGFGPFGEDDSFNSKSEVATRSLLASLMLDDEPIDPFAESSPWGDIQDATVATQNETEMRTTDIPHEDIEATDKARPWDEGAVSKPSVKNEAEATQLPTTDIRKERDAYQKDKADSSTANSPDQKANLATSPSKPLPRRRMVPRKHGAISERTRAAMNATAQKSGTAFVDPLTSAIKEAESQDATNTQPTYSGEILTKGSSSASGAGRSSLSPGHSVDTSTGNSNSSNATPRPDSYSGYISTSPISRAPSTLMSDSERSLLASRKHQALAQKEAEPENESIPEFEITILDPLKVGDALKSHIVYKIVTRTESGILDEYETSVRRRYKDFEWLYHNLTFNHSGVIVPPIPEKQSLGRFDENFIEQRRIGLQSCLRRMVSHPRLYKDPDLILFLQSQGFGTDSRNSSEAKRQKYGALYINHNPKSSSVSTSGSGSSATIRAATGSVGLGLASLFGEAFSKQPKAKDTWFQGKMADINTFESQLRHLLKALESMAKQRRELAIGYSELGQSLLKVAENEINQGLSQSLTSMGSIQQHLKVIQEKQCEKDISTFLITIEEYIRLCQSAKQAFNSRNKLYSRWQSSLLELTRKRKQMEQLVARPSQNTSDLAAQLRSEIGQIEGQTERDRNQFDDTTKLLHKELNRFDMARATDIKKTIEAYLEGMIETQEQIVALWDSYLNGLLHTEASYDPLGPRTDQSIVNTLTAGQSAFSQQAIIADNTSYKGIQIRPPTSSSLHTESKDTKPDKIKDVENPWD